MEQAGVDLRAKPISLRERHASALTEARLYYVGPRGAKRNPAKVKLDLLATEQVVQPSVLREILHPYSDALPGTAEVRCYSFEELFSEKIRALGERFRPRDLYDVIYLFRRQDLQAAPELIRSVLEKKCQSKAL